MQGSWIIALFIGLAGSGSICWILLQHYWNWSRPMKKLIRDAELARKGELSIDELSSITGGVAPLVCLIQTMLRAARQQKAELAALDSEMRQRVAGRTDALERKIGALQLQASRDVLTGLANRRLLEQELPKLLDEFKPDGPDSCMLMMDMDHFKALNDTLGHSAGDQILKEIGQIIQSSIRDGDLAARCGGDEFVVVLKGCSISSATAKAKNLENLVDALARPLRLPQPPHLSIGMCALSELEDRTPLAWMHTADLRLYAAKTAIKLQNSNGKRPKITPNVLPVPAASR